MGTLSNHVCEVTDESTRDEQIEDSFFSANGFKSLTDFPLKNEAFVVRVGVLVASQSADILDVVRDSVGVRMVPSQLVLSNRMRTCNHFLELFRASICLCGGENRKQFGWIVERMDGQVNRSMDDDKTRITNQRLAYRKK